MKYFFVLTLVCNAASLTAMQESAKSLLLKQQYAHQITTLTQQIDCAINHAQALSESFLTLSRQAHIVYTPRVRATMLGKISDLRNKHTQLNEAYNVLSTHRLSSASNRELSLLPAALVVLKNHIETATAHDNLLNQCAQENALAPVAIPSR